MLELPGMSAGAGSSSLAESSAAGGRERRGSLKPHSNKVENWTKAACAGPDGLRDLKMAGMKAGIDFTSHTDAERVLLELCVITVQRAYRLRLALFTMFGNMLFARATTADGRSKAADYGTIRFPHDVDDSPYLVCSDTTSPTLLATFLVHGPWQLKRPNLLITITGGARDFELKPTRLARLFSKGFSEAALAANAIVTAAGTDAGVAKLVASALNETGGSVPIIGIAQFNKVTGWNDPLEGKSGEEVTYANLPPIEFDTRPDGGQGAPKTVNLNPEHTHFIFVDDGGKTNGWGAELQLRAELESRFAQMLRVPVVQLCVQGGPGTLGGMYEACLRGTPVVIIAESGGCATVVYNFVQKGIAIPPSYSAKAVEQINEIKRFNDEYDGRLLTFFSLEDNGNVDLSAVLLKAVVNLQMHDIGPQRDGAQGAAKERRVQRQLSRALKLAVQWDRIDVAQDIIDALGGMRTIYPNGAGSTPAAQEALQMAIQLGRIEFCRQLIHQPGMDVGMVDLTSLYLNPGKFFFLSPATNKLLSAGFDQMFAETKRRQRVQPSAEATESRRSTVSIPGCNVTGRPTAGARPSGSTAGGARPQSAWRMSQARPSNSAGGSSAGGSERHHPRLSSEEKYFIAVAPLFRHISTRLERLVLDYSRFDHADVYFWAVMSGEFDLAKLFWPLTQRPLATAMLGSYVCRYMTNKVFIGKEQVMAQAEVMQDWVVGTLDAIPDESVAHHTLQRSLTDDASSSNFNLVELALFLDMKKVISQRYTQTLIDHIWRGDLPGSRYPLPPDFSWLQVLIWSFFPLVSPPVLGYLAGSNRPQRGPPIFIFDAFAQATKLLANEMERSEEASASFSRKEAEAEAEAAAAAAERERSKKGANHRTPLSLVRKKTHSQTGGAHVTRAMMESHLEHKAEEREVSMFDGDSLNVSGKHLLNFYRIPAVKFLTRTVLHVTVAAQYVAAIMVNPTIYQIEHDGHLPELRTPEVLLFVFAFSKLLDDWYSDLIMRKNGLQFDGASAVRTGLQHVSWMRQVCLVLCIVARIVTLLPNDDGGGGGGGGKIEYDTQVLFYKAYAYMMSIASCLACLNLLEPLSLASEDLSVLVIMIDTMRADIAVFFKLCAVIILAFTFSFIGLEWVGSTTLPPDLAAMLAGKNISEWGYGTSFGFRGGEFFDGRMEEAKPLWTAWWGFLGFYTLEQSDVVADLWMWAYFFFCGVVLVNLLIAMMADTYSRVKETAAVEALSARYRRIFEHRRLMLVVPPPLNAPYVVLGLVRHYARKFFRGCDLAAQTVSGRTRDSSGGAAELGEDSSIDEAEKHRRKRKSGGGERLAKVYVDRFLEEEARMDARTVESLARTAGERTSSLEETFNQRIFSLTEKVEHLSAQQVDVSRALSALCGAMLPEDTLEALTRAQGPAVEEHPHPERSRSKPAARAKAASPPAAAPAAPPRLSAADILAAANASATSNMRRQSMGLGRITSQERDNLSA